MSDETLFAISARQITTEQFLALPAYLQRILATSSHENALRWAFALYVVHSLQANGVASAMAERLGISCATWTQLCDYLARDQFYASKSVYTVKRALLAQACQADIDAVWEKRQASHRMQGIEALTGRVCVRKYQFGPDMPQFPQHLLSVDFSGTRLGALPDLQWRDCRVLLARNCALRRVDGAVLIDMKHIERLDLGQNRMNIDAVCCVLEQVSYTDLWALALDGNFCITGPEDDLAQAAAHAALFVKAARRQLPVDRALYLDFSKMGIRCIERGLFEYFTAFAATGRLHLRINGREINHISSQLQCLAAAEMAQLAQLDALSLDISDNILTYDTRIIGQGAALCDFWRFDHLRAFTAAHAGIGQCWRQQTFSAFRVFLHRCSNLEWLDLSDNAFSQAVSLILSECLEDSFPALRVAIFDSIVNPNDILASFGVRNRRLGADNQIEVLSISHCEHKIKSADMLGCMFSSGNTYFGQDDSDAFKHQQVMGASNLRLLSIAGSYTGSLVTRLADALAAHCAAACTCRATNFAEHAAPDCELFKHMNVPALAFLNRYATQTIHALECLNLSGCRIVDTVHALPAVLQSLNIKWLYLQNCGLSDERCCAVLQVYRARSFRLIDLAGNRAEAEACKLALELLQKQNNAIINLQSTAALKKQDQVAIASMIKQMKGKHACMLCCNIERSAVEPADILIRHRTTTGRLERRLDIDVLFCILNDMHIHTTRPAYCDFGIREFLADDND